MPEGKEEQGVLLLGTVQTLPGCERQAAGVGKEYNTVPAVRMEGKTAAPQWYTVNGTFWNRAGQKDWNRIIVCTLLHKKPFGVDWHQSEIHTEVFELF